MEPFLAFQSENRGVGRPTPTVVAPGPGAGLMSWEDSGSRPPLCRAEKWEMEQKREVCSPASSFGFSQPSRVLLSMVAFCDSCMGLSFVVGGLV